MHDLAANAHLGIICTEHHPRLAVWQMFDQVCLLSEGHACYVGPADGCVPWFKSLGYLLEDVVAGGNPADTCVDLVSINHYKDPALFGKNTMLDEDDVRAAAQAFDAVHRAKLGALVLNVMGSDPEAFDVARRASDDKKRGLRRFLSMAGLSDSAEAASDFVRQYRVLAKRTMESHTRNKGNALARNVLMNIVAVISAGVFGNQHRRSIKGGYVGDYVGEDLTSYYGGLFSWLVFTALMAYVPIGCIQYDRTFFLKERKAGLYSTAAWYCAYMSVETFIITNCSLSCGILYAQLMGFVRCWSVAVRPFGLQILCQLKFAVYFGAICNGLSLLFSQILMLSVAITRNLNAAFIIAMGVFIQGFITSGFPVDLTSMNPDATWLQYTCASAASPSLSVVPRKKNARSPPGPSSTTRTTRASACSSGTTTPRTRASSGPSAAPSPSTSSSCTAPGCSSTSRPSTPSSSGRTAATRTTTRTRARGNGGFCCGSCSWHVRVLAGACVRRLAAMDASLTVKDVVDVRRRPPITKLARHLTSNQ